MKNLLKITFLFMGFFLVANAQETTIFYQSNTVVANSKDNAKYYVVYQPYVEGLIAYKKFSIDNVLLEKGAVLSLASLAKQGKVSTYYSNGNLKDDMYYEAGLPSGQKIHYFENGEMNYKIQQTAAGYGKNSAKKSSTKYEYCANPEGKILLSNGNGEFEEYNSNQVLTQKGVVKNNLPDGIWQGFDNNKLSFIEEYKNGVLIKGQSFGLSGTSKTYFKKSSRPEPKGGINNFYDYIASAMQDMVSNDIQNIRDDIMVNFVVATTGTLKDIRVIKSSKNTKLNNMAVEIIKNSPRWIPATQQGQAVEMAFYIPLSVR